MRVFIFVCIILLSTAWIQLAKASVTPFPLAAKYLTDMGKKIPIISTAKHDYRGFVVYTVDCGVTRLGESKNCYAGFGSGGPSYTFGTGVFTSSSDFTLLSDGCSGQTVTQGGACYVWWSFTPTIMSTQSVEMDFEWSADGTTSSAGLVINVRGTHISPPPRYSKYICGSIIGVDGQTLGEVVPVTGVPWGLTYSTALAGWFRAYDKKFRPTYVSPEKWNVSIHNYYDKSANKLYKGTGSTEYVSHQILSSGNTQVISSLGDEVYIFDPNGKHLQTLTFYTGAVKYSFEYNPTSFRLTSVEDSFGNVTQFIRNANGYLTHIIAPYGQVTTVTRNANGWLTSIKNPNNEAYTFTYKSGTDFLETFTKPGGQISTFTYDGDGRLLKDLGNGGNFWALESSLSSTLDIVVNKTSKMGRSSVYETGYNASGNYIRGELTPYGHETLYTEFSNGSSAFTDGFEDVVETHTTDERVATFRRKSQTTRTIDSTTSTTTYGQTIAPAVLTDIFDFSTITKTMTTSGRTLTEVYDSTTKIFTMTTAEGATSYVGIDTYERPLSKQIGNDIPWSYVYDTNGHLQSLSQGVKNQVTYTYNTYGYLQKITNARGEETNFLYDLVGRVTQVNLPDSRLLQYSYNANGDIVGITPDSRPQHVFTFNPYEAVSSYEPPALAGVALTNTSYSYNNDKQLTQISRPDGQYVLYNYGSNTGLLNSIVQSSDSKIYTYFSNSNRIQKVETSDDIGNSFTYFGNLLATNQQYNSANSFVYAKVSYNYDGDFRMTSRVLQGNSVTPSSIINTVYNDDDRPTQIGDLTLSYSYPSGRISSTIIDRISDVRTYDSYGYLQSYTATYSPLVGTAQVLYAYSLTRDIMSRISSKTETVLGVTDTYVYNYDTAGRLVSVTKNTLPYSSYVYDNNGNKTSGSMAGVSFTSSFDSQDRLLNYNSKTYFYTASGDLSEVRMSPTIAQTFVYDGLGSLKESVLTDGRIITYGVDGHNQRVFKKINSVTDTRYLYSNANQIIATYGDSGVIEREYVYGVEHVSPDYMMYGGQRYRIIKDHLGSPRLVVRSTDGIVFQRIDYTDLGKIILDTNPNFQNYGFAGGIYDSDTQLVRFGARDYDPETGRWTSKDPILFAGRMTNLYGYSFNDPVNFIDPNGLAPGDSFPTEGEAAGDALNYINPISIGQNREYGGYIVKNPDGSYMATNPIKGGPAGVSIGPVPAGGSASYHTHGGYDPRYDNENFSPADILGDALSGLNGYLGTPGGSIQMNTGGRIKKGLTCPR